jgi:hypothetical protein
MALRPPVTIEDLKADTEYDPEGAEEFVAFIRAARQGNSSRHILLLPGVKIVCAFRLALSSLAHTAHSWLPRWCSRADVRFARYWSVVRFSN